MLACRSSSRSAPTLNPHSTRCQPVPNFPRLRALALFGRRRRSAWIASSCWRPKTYTTSDVIRQRSSWATSIAARAVGHPAKGKALRPQHSPRVVFFELARFRAVGQKASLGTPQAGARPMTRPPGPRAPHAQITSLCAAPWRAKDRCSRKPLADLLHPQVFRQFLATVRDDIERHLGAIRQAVQAGFLDGRNMDENALAAAIRRDEAITLLGR